MSDIYRYRVSYQWAGKWEDDFFSTPDEVRAWFEGMCLHTSSMFPPQLVTVTPLGDEMSIQQFLENRHA